MKVHKRKLGIIAILIVMVLTMVGCNGSIQSNSEEELPEIDKTVSTTEGDSESITLVGIGNGDIEVTVDEIKELEIINRDVISISSSGEETPHNVSGGLLEELLGKHGVSQKDLASIRVTAIDGYSMEIPSEVLKNRDIILAYEIDGEELFKGSEPIRIIIPEERAMYWVRRLSTVEITEGEVVANEQVEKILIFDTAIENLDEQDYEYYENVDKAIKIDDLLNEFVPGGNEQVSMKAADGLQRNETKETFKSAFIKVTGKDTPMFLSPDLSKGMYIKDMLWFSTEKVAFLTKDKALETYSKLTGEDIEGIALKDVFEDINLKQGDTYIFTADDGYSAEVSKDDIDKGILYKKDDGNMRVSFEGLQKNTTVKNLLSIEVK